jgi:hypothetical protein
VADFEISPMAHAYLLAFDNWLHTVWRVSPNPAQDDSPATELKDACLFALLHERDQEQT